MPGLELAGIRPRSGIGGTAANGKILDGVDLVLLMVLLFCRVANTSAHIIADLRGTMPAVGSMGHPWGLPPGVPWRPWLAPWH